MPLERRTLAILRSAEFGFFGVAVLTAVQTPLFCGEEVSIARFCKELYPFCRAGAVDFLTAVCLPFLTNWLNVGILFTSCDIVCWLLYIQAFAFCTQKHCVKFARHIIISIFLPTVKIFFIFYKDFLYDGSGFCFPVYG